MTSAATPKIGERKTFADPDGLWFGWADESLRAKVKRTMWCRFAHQFGPYKVPGGMSRRVCWACKVRLCRG